MISFKRQKLLLVTRLTLAKRAEQEAAEDNARYFHGVPKDPTVVDLRISVVFREVTEHTTAACAKHKSGGKGKAGGGGRGANKRVR